ncbi:MAG: cyclic nucleotide-binding domain-containing protein [Chloroflexi bacterium]|jgi:hypothetical protein|nr:cyclic nucleotide-binding domain-containing protein [Chloroflexota bacterium]
MTTTNESLIQLLRESALFSAMEDIDLPVIAEVMVAVELPAGEVLFVADEERDGLFIVEAGKLIGREAQKGAELPYQRGDLIGLGSSAYPHTWQEDVQALSDSQLWFIPNEQLASLCDQSQPFQETLTVLASSQNLIRTIPKPWLEADEKVSLITRKHPVFLLFGAIPPIVVFLLILLGLYYLQAVYPIAALFGMLAAFFFCAIWLAWNVHNWSNDFYLITSKRMVWVEKVSGFYDSRQEAPLGTLISVGVHTTQPGAILGYSDVIVRTFIGDIRFERVAHAKTIGKLIESYWAKSKHIDLELDARAIRRALRQKFGKAPEEVSAKELEHEYGIENELPQQEMGFFQWLFSDFMKVRYEGAGVVTYRKHWLILVQKNLLPLLGLLLTAALMIAVVTRNITGIDYKMALTLGSFLLFVFAATMFYQYVDWRNDIFQLTPNQVIDLDRKPFGQESRRAAPLENILSIEYERRGIIPMLFNFGTVYITVGNSQLTFNDVWHPSDVQRDIFARMGTNIQDKEHRQTIQERERIAQWFKVFQEETQAGLLSQDITFPLNPPPA